MIQVINMHGQKKMSPKHYKGSVLSLPQHRNENFVEENDNRNERSVSQPIPTKLNVSKSSDSISYSEQKSHRAAKDQMAAEPSIEEQEPHA